MDESPRQGLRQLPRNNPRKLSGFEVEALFVNGVARILSLPVS
jgi:hypothetical protein